MDKRYRSIWRGGLAAAFVATSVSIVAPGAHAQSEPFLGQIMYVGFNFCPKGWLPANGDPLPLSQNTALFSLLGNRYGGNGMTHFRLPDLRRTLAAKHPDGSERVLLACIAVLGIFPSRN